MKTATQTKTFRFRMSWKDEDGVTHIKRYFNFDDAFKEHQIPRNAYFALSRKENIPKWKRFIVDRIREPAREIIQVVE